MKLDREKDLDSFNQTLKRKNRGVIISLGYFNKEGKEKEYIYLYELRISKRRRRKGIGTSIMTDICEYADINHMCVYLTPVPLDDEIEITRLIGFYRRFGFRRKGKSNIFRRAPSKRKCREGNLR